MATGTKEDPYTVADRDVDRRYKWCRCQVCSQVKQCTPDCDFWLWTHDPKTEEPLPAPRFQCDPCDNAWLATLFSGGVIDKRPQDRQRQEGTQN